MDIKGCIKTVKDKFNKLIINSRNEKSREEMLKDHNKQLKEKFVDDTGIDKSKNQTKT